jgi:integrase/recombinase XerD
MDGEEGLRVEKFFDAPQNHSLEVFAPTPALELNHKIETQTPSVSPQMVVNPARLQDELLIRTWLSSKSKNTIRSYSRIAKEFLDWIHPADLKSASIHHVQGFLEERGIFNRSTKALKVASIKSLLTHAQRTGYLPVNFGAFVRGVKSDSKITDRYLTEKEVVRMIEASRTPRDEAVVRLLYSGGLRVSELVSLDWENFQTRDDHEGQLKIRGKGDKVRVVMISKAATLSLMKLKKEDARSTDPIFGSDYGMRTRLTDRTVRDIVFKVAIRAGIEKKVSPHWLRHAHASHSLDRGAPIHLVQTTLGHASVATTGQYLHSRPKESSGKFLKE